MTRGAVRRFPIRYAIQRWNDSAWLYGALLVASLAVVVGKAIARQPVYNIVPVPIICAVFLLGFWLMRRLSYVEISNEAVRVRYVSRQLTIPYASLSRVRRQPLEVAFQPAERRRYVNRFVRRLAREPAAYIRLDRRQNGIVEEAERRLGPRFVTGADIVIPILDVDDFVSEMKGRLRGQAGG
jgi:hypothetical protein